MRCSDRGRTVSVSAVRRMRGYRCIWVAAQWNRGQTFTFGKCQGAFSGVGISLCGGEKGWYLFGYHPFSAGVCMQKSSMLFQKVQDGKRICRCAEELAYEKAPQIGLNAAGRHDEKYKCQTDAE